MLLLLLLLLLQAQLHGVSRRRTQLGHWQCAESAWLLLPTWFAAGRHVGSAAGCRGPLRPAAALVHSRRSAAATAAATTPRNAAAGCSRQHVSCTVRRYCPRYRRREQASFGRPRPASWHSRRSRQQRGAQQSLLLLLLLRAGGVSPAESGGGCCSAAAAG
jgi:hypothetical protein